VYDVSEYRSRNIELDSRISYEHEAERIVLHPDESKRKASLILTVEGRCEEKAVPPRFIRFGKCGLGLLID